MPHTNPPEARRVAKALNFSQLKVFAANLETVNELSFSRFSGSFEPIFDSNFGGNIKLRILSPKFESKRGVNRSVETLQGNLTKRFLASSL
jgi:hypothetical protein